MRNSWPKGLEVSRWSFLLDRWIGQLGSDRGLASFPVTPDICRQRHRQKPFPAPRQPPQPTHTATTANPSSRATPFPFFPRFISLSLSLNFSSQCFQHHDHFSHQPPLSTGGCVISATNVTQATDEAKPWAVTRSCLASLRWFMAVVFLLARAALAARLFS